MGEIIYDMGSFMLILMVIVAGFGLAFWVNLHDEDPDFGDPITAIFSVSSLTLRVRIWVRIWVSVRLAG